VKRRLKVVEPISNLGWVRKATSTDAARPVLTGVYATENHLVATDGRRLHLAPNASGYAIAATTPEEYALQLGLWALGKDENRRIDGTFPNYTNLQATYPPVFHLELADTYKVIALCRAAEAGNKALRVGKEDGPQVMVGLSTYLTPEEAAANEELGRGTAAPVWWGNPLYIREALEGLDPQFGKVRVGARSGGPWLFVQMETLRAAEVMPIRVENRPDASPFRFDATPFFTVINPVAIPVIDSIGAKKRRVRKQAKAA
jgi:hypothetical protein